MKNAFLLAVLSLGLTLGVVCQDAPSISTSTQDGARFEVLYSTLDRGATFRLDKYIGTIDRLGTCPKDDGYGSKLCWKEMIVVEHSKGASIGRPRRDSSGVNNHVMSSSSE